MTAATPITTPISVKTLRSLCAQRLEAEMATASDKFIVVGRGIEPGDSPGPHPNIRAGQPSDFGQIRVQLEVQFTQPPDARWSSNLPNPRSPVTRVERSPFLNFPSSTRR